MWNVAHGLNLWCLSVIIRFYSFERKKKLYILQNILFEYFKNDMKVSK